MLIMWLKVLGSTDPEVQAEFQNWWAEGANAGTSGQGFWSAQSCSCKGAELRSAAITEVDHCPKPSKLNWLPVAWYQ